MDMTQKEIKTVFESLLADMILLLEMDPMNGWYWVVEAERRVIQHQMDQVGEGHLCPL